MPRVRLGVNRLQLASQLDLPADVLPLLKWTFIETKLIERSVWCKCWCLHGIVMQF